MSEARQAANAGWELNRKNLRGPVRRIGPGGVLRSIGIGFVLVVAALPFEHAAARLAGAPPLVFLHIAVGMAAWYAGPVGGVTAVSLALVLAETTVMVPSLVDQPGLPELVRAIVFTLIAAGVAWGVFTLRRTMRRAGTHARRAQRLATRLRGRTGQLEYAARRYRRLQQVAAALLRALTPQQVVDVVMGAGVSAADANAALLLKSDGSVLGGAGLPDGLLDAVERANIQQAGPLTAVLIDGEACWLGSDVPLLGPAANGAVASTLPLSWAVLPLSVRERRLGALIFGYEGDRQFSEEDRTFALLFAQQCAQALDRSRMYQAERTARVQAQFAERQIGFLAAVTAKLSSSFDLQRCLADVVDLVATSMGDFCAIHVVDDQGKVQLAAAAQSRNGTQIHFGPGDDCLPIDAAATRGYPGVIRSGEPDLVHSVDEPLLEQMGRTPANTERLREMGLATMFCAPLKVRERVIGTVTIGSSRRNRRFSLTELSLGDELALRLTQAIDNAQLYNAALQASRAKSTFLAVMSHELRTPLNAIIGYSDLVLLGVPSPITDETRHQVERIRRAAHHLLHLVDDVLNFARVESGRDRLYIAPVPLDATVGEAAALLLPMAKEKKIEIRHRSKTGVMLKTDPNKLVQILNNLLVNAVKFTDEGVVEIAARVEGDDAVIVVTDTGIGIAEDNLDRVFDPFWQAEQSPTRRYGGTGIGLGVARNLARLLGGDLTVISRTGTGSVFTLRIPREIDAPEPEPAPE